MRSISFSPNSWPRFLLESSVGFQTPGSITLGTKSAYKTVSLCMKIHVPAQSTDPRSASDGIYIYFSRMIFLLPFWGVFGKTCCWDSWQGCKYWKKRKKRKKEHRSEGVEDRQVILDALLRDELMDTPSGAQGWGSLLPSSESRQNAQSTGTRDPLFLKVLKAWRKLKLKDECVLLFILWFNFM